MTTYEDRVRDLIEGVLQYHSEWEEEFYEWLRELDDACVEFETALAKEQSGETR